MMACGCDAYNRPAAGSYAVENHQVKIDGRLLAVQGAAVTLAFFQSAGVQPLVGRFFIDGDQRSSPPHVVVLSHEMWREHFDSSPAIVGRPLEVDGQPATVVGIAPRGFTFPESAELWIPSSTLK
jgi:hypothetical protein